MINGSEHCADKLEVVKKITQGKSAEIDQLQSEIAEREKTEAELQQKLAGMCWSSLCVKSLHVIKRCVHCR